MMKTPKVKQYLSTGQTCPEHPTPRLDKLWKLFCLNLPSWSQTLLQ